MKWDEAAYSRYDVDENGNPLTLEEYERRRVEAGRFQLTKGEIKLLSIAGVGFFLDSYDLFIINLVNPIWTFEYWGGLATHPPKVNGGHYPPLLKGLVNASANIGNVIGQLSFGFLGDTFGRKFVYGKELLIAMFGLIMVIALPNSIHDPYHKAAWLIVFRIIMGIGIGGDYPMSAAITSERSHLKRRGTMLGIIFSNQGWGTLAGSIVTIILLAIFEPALNKRGELGQIDAIWRIQMGLALFPAAITLPFRLRMPEGKQYIASQELNKRSPSSSVDAIASEKQGQVDSGSNSDIVAPGQGVLAPNNSDKFTAFFRYFSEWRHFKLLFATASTWFLVDVAFYGINLNQTQILAAIGFSKGVNEYHFLMRGAIGNLIIAVAGYVPGYFFTIAFVEILGRKTIQIGGFVLGALFFAIIAGAYNHIGVAGRFVCFAFAQFFFNFGPNATTFIVPAEIFPTRVRGLAHGLSAAVGKLGAILSALLFNYLSAPNKLGLRNVLWIFFACNMLGAVITWFFLVETKGRDADVVDYEEYIQANPHMLGRHPSTTPVPATAQI